MRDGHAMLVWSMCDHFNCSLFPEKEEITIHISLLSIVSYLLPWPKIETATQAKHRRVHAR